MQPPVWQDYYDVGVYTTQVRRPSLIVYPGDVTDAMIAGCATMASTLTGYGAGRFKITFLNGAAGDDLTADCADRGVERYLAAPSVGVVSFSRAGFTAGAGTIPAGFRVATQPDTSGTFQVFTTDHDTVFGAVDLAKDAFATCSVTDVVGNVDVGEITRALDLATLWDQSIVVVNAAKFAGGAPEESDPDLIDRTRNFFLTQARGTRDALIFAAKTVPGVKRASIVVDESGIISLYVADAEGNSNPALADAVSAVIVGPPAWADAGDIVDVIGASLYTASIDLSLTVRLGVDVNQLLDSVRRAVVASTNRLQPGETLVREKISAAAMAVDPDGITKCQVNIPAVDLVPIASQAIATDISHITFS